MSKMNMLPPAIQQMVEAVADPSTPMHVKHNYIQTLDVVVDVCSSTVKSWRDMEAGSLIKNKRQRFQKV